MPCPGFFQTQTEAARAEHGQADDAVRAVVDVIADLGDEVQVVDARTESSLGEGVVQRTELDPADPPMLDGKGAVIADEGMIGLGLFRRR